MYVCWVGTSFDAGAAVLCVLRAGSHWWMCVMPLLQLLPHLISKKRMFLSCPGGGGIHSCQKLLQGCCEVSYFFIYCVFYLSLCQYLLICSSSRIIHRFNLMQNFLTFDTGFLLLFPTIRVPFTFVINDVIPTLTHFRFDDCLPSQYICWLYSRMPTFQE